MKVNDEDIPSNKVVVKTPEIKSSIKKSIIEGDKLVEQNESELGKDVNYLLEYTIGNGKAYKSAEFSDDLEDVLDIDKDSIKVYTEKDSEQATDSEEQPSEEQPSEEQPSDDKATDSEEQATDDKASDEEQATDDKATDSEEQVTDSEEQATDDKATDSEEQVTDSEEQATDDKATDEEQATDDKASDEESKVPNKDNLEDITKEGDLTVDEDKESFNWKAKDPKSLKGKKVYIEVNGEIKDDADLSKYEKDGKALIPNVSKMKLDEDETESNKVLTGVPEKEEPPKEDPKDPDDGGEGENEKPPEKEQPKEEVTKDKEPSKETPDNKGESQKEIPNTGSKSSVFDRISQSIFNVFK